MATEKRLIDANALIDYFKEQCEIASKDSEIESLYVLAALKCCIDCFEHFPTVDAVEVVRCEDCKHGKLEDVMYYRTVDGETNDTTLYRCYYRWNYSELNKGEHFCSYGERRTDV